jgi:fimbrial chaperone protein
MLCKFSSSVVSILMLMLPVMASANGFGINATRLIYPANAESISVSLRNTMQTLPYLVQSRVSRSSDGVTSAPFQVRPPLFRLEPGSTNQVRIVAIKTNLPEDRESVFYFLATAIPASTAPKHDSQQSLVSGTTQFGIGNTIKLFYRPSHLPGSSEDAQRGLQISRVSEGIEISNPSPYFVSFASIQVGGHTLKLDSSEALMLAPFGKHIYPLSSAQGQVRWKTINDEGGVNAFTYNLP